MLRWLARVLEGLFVLFAGTIVIYLLRHFLVLGCGIGMVLCLTGLAVVGKIDGRRNRRAIPQSASGPVMSVVKGATGAIGDAVRLSLTPQSARGVSGVAGTAGATGPRGPVSKDDGGPVGPS